jgi:pre-mRNA-splicing factor SYF2
MNATKMFRLKADVEERGDDVERQKNWEWSIEENVEWEKKLARKAPHLFFVCSRLFPLFTSFLSLNDARAARRKYKKDIDKARELKIATAPL